jgi:hypothetical protein
MKKTIVWSLSAWLLTGCATAFTGDAHVEGGRQGCEAKCQGEGMAVAGMVFMGEYTSGCVCTVPGQAAPPQAAVAAGGGAGAAAAGVAMQMRRQQAQQQTR